MTRWIDEIWRAYRQHRLTPLSRDVLLRLETFRGRGGLIYPSHQSLALRARCSVKTVQRALAAGMAAGLVSWRAVWRRVGWSSHRSSNVYVLETPENPDAGQSGRRTLRVVPSISFSVASGPDRGESIAALARVRAERELKLLRNKSAKPTACGNGLIFGNV